MFEPASDPHTGDEELDFLNLLLMLGNTAAVELGDKNLPSGEKKLNLPRARQFINMLVVLEKKTAGQLEAQEEQVLKKLLEDLREKYVKASGLEAPDSASTAGLAAMAAQAYGRAKRP